MPERIAAKKSKLVGVKPAFQYTFAPRSVTVLRVKLVK